LSWSLAKRVDGCSFSAAAEAGIDISLNSLMRSAAARPAE
jgi:hypothetical protein